MNVLLGENTFFQIDRSDVAFRREDDALPWLNYSFDILLVVRSGEECFFEHEVLLPLAMVIFEDVLMVEELHISAHVLDKEINQCLIVIYISSILQGREKQLAL